VSFCCSAVRQNYIGQGVIPIWLSGDVNPTLTAVLAPLSAAGNPGFRHDLAPIDSAES
jgi:hypothetical protein